MNQKRKGDEEEDTHAIRISCKHDRSLLLAGVEPDLLETNEVMAAVLAGLTVGTVPVEEARTKPFGCEECRKLWKAEVDVLNG